MSKIGTAFAGITAGLITLFFGTTPGAEAAPAHPVTVTVKSVCETGFRGQPAYDAKCLSHNPYKAAALWFSTPEGKRGHLRDDMETRRSVCKYAPRHGGVRAVASDMVHDMAYDQFADWHKAIRVFADAAQGDCLRMGYADPVSGMVPVNLHDLPPVKGDCWIEVSYLDAKHTRVNVEPICKG